MHFSNGRFSNKETGFSGPYVVWSLRGAPGEKKKKTNCIYMPRRKNCFRPRKRFLPKKEPFVQPRNLIADLLQNLIENLPPNLIVNLHRNLRRNLRRNLHRNLFTNVIDNSRISKQTPDLL